MAEQSIPYLLALPASASLGGAFGFFLGSEWPGPTSRRQRFFRYQVERIVARAQAKGRGLSVYSSSERR